MTRSGDLGNVYRDGEWLIRQGEVGDCMFVIQEGRVDIVVERDGREVHIGTAGHGEILGEMAIFERAPRSASVRAVGDVRVLTLDKRAFLKRMHADPSLAFRILQTMSRRVRTLTDELARLRR